MESLRIPDHTECSELLGGKEYRRIGAGWPRPAAHPRGQCRFRAGFLWPRGVSDGLGAAQHRGILPGADQGLHVRAGFPRGELERQPPPRRVLDDRAGDRLFADLSDNAALAEALLKYTFAALLNERQEDPAFFDQRIEKGLVAKLEGIVGSEFVHMDYGEAIAVLELANEKFEFPVKWGIDLPSEHERYLTEQYAKKPVIVMNYPKAIKAFYMRLNDDGRADRPGNVSFRIGLRVIDRHLAVSVEGNLVRRPSTDSRRPTYRGGSGYAADRPKNRHIGLHGAGTRRPSGEILPMRP
jgi:hypothetical protein